MQLNRNTFCSGADGAPVQCKRGLNQPLEPSMNKEDLSCFETMRDRPFLHFVK